MTIKKAREIVATDHKALSECELQKYRVSLIDAWRYAKGDWGYQNDFFCYCGELKAYIPKDYWLLKNIEARMAEVGL